MDAATCRFSLWVDRFMGGNLEISPYFPEIFYESVEDIPNKCWHSWIASIFIFVLRLVFFINTLLEIKTFGLVSTIGDVFSEIHKNIALWEISGDWGCWDITWGCTSNLIKWKIYCLDQWTNLKLRMTQKFMFFQVNV